MLTCQVDLAGVERWSIAELLYQLLVKRFLKFYKNRPTTHAGPTTNKLTSKVILSADHHGQREAIPVAHR